jgi:hypothetical protein
VDVLGQNYFMIDGIPRNLAGTRQHLGGMGLQLVDLTPDNRGFIAACLVERGFGPRHHFWVESWDGVRNGVDEASCFVVNVSRTDPRELERLPATAGFPYRHLAQRASR